MNSLVLSLLCCGCMSDLEELLLRCLFAVVISVPLTLFLCRL